jgi:hypothetical protein
MSETHNQTGSGTDAKNSLEHLSVPEALKQPAVDPKAGLTAAEALP